MSYIKIWGQGFLRQKRTCYAWGTEEQCAGAREGRAVMRSDVRDRGKRPGHEAL